MSGRLPQWFTLMYQTPGEMYPLDEVGRFPAKLSDALGEMDREQSLNWSGQLFGNPTILDRLVKTQQYDLDPENVLPVNGGTTMGIFLTCMALLKPGDEVICESPAWTQVGTICERMGIKVNWWHLRSANNWKPDLEELSRLIHPKVKLIYINHPNNPTGSLLTKEDMAELCDIASRYGTYVLSDEVYRGLEWQGNDLSPAVVNFYDRGVSVSSLTKTIGATGIRFGWLATREKELLQRCFSIHYDSVLCNNIFSERIGEKLLEPSRYGRLLKEGKDVGQANLSALREMVERDEVWSMTPPGGAFSCFVKYETGEPSWDFCTRMLKKKPKGVYLVPGVCYNDDCEYHVRIGFGVKEDVFRTALKVLEEGVREYRGKK